MARSKARRATSRSRRPVARPKRVVRRSPPPRPKSGWSGRDSSPVLDRYAPKPVDAPVGTPARPAPPVPPASRPAGSGAAAGGAATPVGGAPTTPPTPVPSGLISLERPFDIEGFSRSLGETVLRVSVPREDLAEVLRRITDFMGFGIYVYSFRVYPEPKESLQRFVVELRRVDFSAARGDWVPFEEKGTSDNPFGPSSA